MKIKKFDRKMCRMVGDQIVAQLETWAEDHGVEIHRDGGSFESGYFDMKLRISTVQDGIAQTPERADFESMAEFYGLKPEWLDATFQWGGDQYTIVGLKTRAKKYPVLGRRTDGKTFKFTLGIVKAAMEQGPPDGKA